MLWLSTLISCDEEHTVVVTFIWPAEGSLAQANLTAHELVSVLKTLGHDTVEDVVHDCDQEIQQDNNVEYRAPEEYGPGPEGVLVHLVGVKVSNTDVVCGTHCIMPLTKISRHEFDKSFWLSFQIYDSIERAPGVKDLPDRLDTISESQDSYE